MSNLKNKERFVQENANDDAKCFFCEEKKGLKAFRSFFICQNCVISASKIHEEISK